jgi:hypothetical protein
VEAASIMEAVFQSGRFDLRHQGDWEDVQIELGLLSERITPSPLRGPGRLALADGNFPPAGLQDARSNSRLRPRRGASESSPANRANGTGAGGEAVSHQVAHVGTRFQAA